MRYNTCWQRINKDFYIDLAAYCNQPNIFKQMNPEQYIVKRTKDKERQDNFIAKYRI